MNILIAAASKHGSTDEIAQVIADELDTLGMNAQLRDFDDIGDIAEFDAVLLGSAVYYGNWMKEAKKFAERNSEELKKKAVWLFSSGPVSDKEPQEKDQPRHIEEIVEMTGARGHTIFVGKLDLDDINFLEKMIIKGVKAPYGDFRNWHAIREWADEIAKALQPTAAPAD